MPRRILFIHGLSKIGGAERDLLKLLQCIDRERWELSLVCPPGPLAVEAMSLQVAVHPMTLPAWRKGRDAFLIPMAVWSLRKLIQRHRIDLVHVNDFWWVPPAYLAARKARVACVAHIRSQIEQKRVGQYWLGKPHRLVAVSHSIKEVVVKAGLNPSQILVVPSGMDVPAALGPEERHRLRDSLHLPDQPLIGTVANLFPHKGLECLMDALVEVRKRVANIHCLLVGQGDERYRVSLLNIIGEQGLARTVTFVGFQKNVFPYIAALDIFVLPSKLEGLPISILEALAMAKPVVATAVGGIPEVIEDHITGLLVPPGNPAALAKGILYLLENPQVGEKLGCAGQARVRERFSVGRMVAQHERLYEDLC